MTGPLSTGGETGRRSPTAVTAPTGSPSSTTAVLLVEGDTQVLRDGAARRAVKYLPPGYTVLKETSHVPLALFVLLHGAEGPLADPTRQALETLGAEVRRARSSLGAEPFPKDTLARQEQLLDASIALIENVTKRGAVAACYPMSEASEALDAARRGGQFGKVTVRHEG